MMREIYKPLDLHRCKQCQRTYTRYVRICGYCGSRNIRKV